MNPVLRRTSRLGVLLLLIALICSRFTLVLHELVGHGLTAIAVGGGVKGFHLFYFAGGYIEFDGGASFSVTTSLIVSLGGIALELLLGAIALWLARRWRPGSDASAGRRVLHAAALGIAAIEIVHALFYLGAGTFHGYGDGMGLHRLLGGARLWLVLPVCVVAVAAAFALARALGATLRGWLADVQPKTQLAVIAGAIAIAGAGHAALTFGELALTPSSSYAQVMEHQGAREAKVELARYYRARIERGDRMTDAELESKREALIEANRPFPLQVALAIALLIAMCFGVATARPTATPAADVPDWSALRRPAAVVVASLALIAALRLVG